MSDAEQKELSDVEKEKLAADEHEIYIGSKVEYYGALVEAWINTRMERDKQILSLSSLALGGLIALQLAGLDCMWGFSLWFLSGVAFVVAIFLALIILSINAYYIEGLVRDSKSNNFAGYLKKLDIALMSVFFIGVILTFALAISKSTSETAKTMEVFVNG